MARTFQELLDLFYPTPLNSPVGPVGPANAIPNMTGDWARRDPANDST